MQTRADRDWLRDFVTIQFCRPPYLGALDFRETSDAWALMDWSEMFEEWKMFEDWAFSGKDFSLADTIAIVDLIWYRVPPHTTIRCINAINDHYSPAEEQRCALEARRSDCSKLSAIVTDFANAFAKAAEENITLSIEDQWWLFDYVMTALACHSHGTIERLLKEEILPTAIVERFHSTEKEKQMRVSPQTRGEVLQWARLHSIKLTHGRNPFTVNTKINIQ